MKPIVSPPKQKVKARKAPSALTLLDWYDHHQRILPWRALPHTTPNPYHVWLSEVMLQQTTVATVGPYFQKFIKRWPTIRHLAKAPIDDVMRMWAGLGYYRRAHLLHTCANLIVDEYRGNFPEAEQDLLQLPGFGPYTAAAVAAIAFNQRANVVDGNIERVVSRLFAVRESMPKAKTKLRKLAATLLPDERYGDYAQAVMDLGATICTPRNPKCSLCPWSGTCSAEAMGIAADLPRREQAAKKPIRRARAFIMLNKKGEIFLRQRPEKGLLGGMMEVPSSAWHEAPMPSLESVAPEAPAPAKWQEVPGIVRHIFSHFELEIAVAIGTPTRAIKGTWVSIDQLDNEALPSVMRKIVSHAKDAIMQNAHSRR